MADMIQAGAPPPPGIHRMILPRFWGRNERSLGLTIIELLIVTMIMATLASLGVPLYANTLNNARITKAVADIRILEKEILVFQLFNGTFPNNLNQIGRDTLRDPYGNPYQYLDIATAGKGKGNFRKDKNLVPINSDFDLYSIGQDGQSVPPLTAKQSWDDIVRAANGGFVGLASEF
jgi:general secretion pathway protein G